MRLLPSVGQPAPPPALTPRLAALPAGNIYPNPALRDNPQVATVGDKVCYLGSEEVPCCTWQMTPGATFYTAFLWLFISWSTYAAFQLRQFAIAGCISQWYFTPITAGPQPGTLTT